MFWPWEIVERDHELQNPTSAEKIRLLGDYLRLGSGSRVLDVASGRGGPATILAATYGCHVTGLELRPAFAEEARRRARERGLASLIDVQVADASTVELEPEAFDAVLCLGAAFVWGTIADAAAALAPAVRRGGFLAVGEPFWRRLPLPAGVERKAFVALAETVTRLESAGVRVTGMIAASEDDWDRYKSFQWRAVEEWVADHPEHPEAASFRAASEGFRGEYLAGRRDLLGWAIFVGRKG